LALDGVCPRAKVHDQKRRRLGVTVGKGANQQMPVFKEEIVKPADEIKIEKAEEEVKETPLVSEKLELLIEEIKDEIIASNPEEKVD